MGILRLESRDREGAGVLACARHGTTLKWSSSQAGMVGSKWDWDEDGTCDEKEKEECKKAPLRQGVYALSENSTGVLEMLHLNQCRGSCDYVVS